MAGGTEQDNLGVRDLSIQTKVVSSRSRFHKDGVVSNGIENAGLMQYKVGKKEIVR